MRDYDVIVVGARVAGASTAMLLAQLGHSVLVVDRADLPSDTTSTHAITRTGVVQLRRWGLLDEVDEIAPRIEAVRLGFGKQRIDFTVSDEHQVDRFYAPRRMDLDWLLAGRARAAGAEIRDGTRVRQLARHGNDVVGVVTDQRVITSRIVVGADGVWSRVASDVRSAAFRNHAPTNAVNYAYYRDVECDGFWFQFSEGINAGLIPTANNETCVFVGRPTEDYGRFGEDPDGEIERLLVLAAPDLWERVGSGVRIGGFRGTRGLPGFMKKSFGPGWVLVGDAGYTKDPISAHGISDALRDAELCARAVDDSLQGDPTALPRYQRIRDSLSRAVYEESRVLAEYQWGPQEASRRMRRISGAIDKECEVLSALPQWRGSLARSVA